jgi:hypothetical protein
MIDARKSQIIGGMFGLEEFPKFHGSKPTFLTKQSICLANAMPGISLLIEMLSPDHVWVPSYLCGAILEAVKSSGTSLRLYAEYLFLSARSILAM